MKLRIAGYIWIVVAICFIGYTSTSSKAQKRNSCASFLRDAQRHVASYRKNLWIGTDGNRMQAAVDLTDYLTCKEENEDR